MTKGLVKSLINDMNNMHQGRGIRMLTEKGSQKYNELVAAEKKSRGIHHNKDVSYEPWAIEIHSSLFAPDLEGEYWGYGKVTPKH